MAENCSGKLYSGFTSPSRGNLPLPDRHPRTFPNNKGLKDRKPAGFMAGFLCCNSALLLVWSKLRSGSILTLLTHCVNGAR